jgi:hypothetical protein
MQITVIPQGGLPGITETVFSVSGDVLTANDVAYDLSGIPEGGLATPEAEGDEILPFDGTITRTNGEICLSVLYKFDTMTAEPNQPKELVTVSLTSGVLPDPITRKPEPEPEPEPELEPVEEVTE